MISHCSAMLASSLETQDEGKAKPEVDTGEETVKRDPFGPKCYYDKAKSFFDNISSDHKSR